jgi:predicted nuclease of predicted toxin-antitoxin system
LKLELDENIGARGQAALRDAGHDVATVHEQRLGGSADMDLARLCEEEGRGLVTLDLDFANPVRFPPEAHPGIAVLRLPRNPAPSDLSALVSTFIEALKTLAGQLWIVERGRIREYDRNRSGLA